MIKLFILIIIISISGCVNKNIKQRMMYKNPGLVALHDLIVGEKTRKEVLIFGCTNHPADYSDKELCKCVNSSKAHLIESKKRNLSCGYNNKEYKRSTFKQNDSKTKDRFMKESTKSLENYYTRNLTLNRKIKEKVSFNSKLPKCPNIKLALIVSYPNVLIWGVSMDATAPKNSNNLLIRVNLKIGKDTVTEV